MLRWQRQVYTAEAYRKKFGRAHTEDGLKMDTFRRGGASFSGVRVRIGEEGVFKLKKRTTLKLEMRDRLETGEVELREHQAEKTFNSVGGKLFAQSKAAAPSLSELLQAVGQGEEEKDESDSGDVGHGGVDGGSSDEEAALFKDALTVYCGKAAPAAASTVGPKGKALPKGGSGRAKAVAASAGASGGSAAAAKAKSRPVAAPARLRMGEAAGAGGGGGTPAPGAAQLPAMAKAPVPGMAQAWAPGPNVAPMATAPSAAVEFPSKAGAEAASPAKSSGGASTTGGETPPSKRARTDGATCSTGTCSTPPGGRALADWEVVGNKRGRPTSSAEVIAGDKGQISRWRFDLQGVCDFRVNQGSEVVDFLKDKLKQACDLKTAIAAKDGSTVFFDMPQRRGADKGKPRFPEEMVQELKAWAAWGF